eukprot:Skav205143  [mRNA]  locus=scaffold3411:284540:285816:+ [translate_table: standard]
MQGGVEDDISTCCKGENVHLLSSSNRRELVHHSGSIHTTGAYIAADATQEPELPLRHDAQVSKTGTRPGTDQHFEKRDVSKGRQEFRVQAENALNDEYGLLRQLQNVAGLFLDSTCLEAELWQFHCFTLQESFQILLDFVNTKRSRILKIQLPLGIPWMRGICSSFEVHVTFQGPGFQAAGLQVKGQARSKGRLPTAGGPSHHHCARPLLRCRCDAVTEFRQGVVLQGLSLQSHVGLFPSSCRIIAFLHSKLHGQWSTQLSKAAGDHGIQRHVGAQELEIAAGTPTDLPRNSFQGAGNCDRLDGHGAKGAATWKPHHVQAKGAAVDGVSKVAALGEVLGEEL